MAASSAVHSAPIMLSTPATSQQARISVPSCRLSAIGTTFLNTPEPMTALIINSTAADPPTVRGKVVFVSICYLTVPLFYSQSRRLRQPHTAVLQDKSAIHEVLGKVQAPIQVYVAGVRTGKRSVQGRADAGGAFIIASPEEGNACLPRNRCNFQRAHDPSALHQFDVKNPVRHAVAEPKGRGRVFQ